MAPAARGRGVGSALLRHRLARIDGALPGRPGAPAHLEAKTAASRALHERHGFRLPEMLDLTADGYPAAMERAGRP